MLDVLIGPVTGLLDKFIEDKDQKARLAHEIATLAERQAHEIATAQIAVNKEEAKSHSMFVDSKNLTAPTRTSIGWIMTSSIGSMRYVSV